MDNLESQVMESCDIRQGQCFIKIAIFGGAHAGKSSLLRRFADDVYADDISSTMHSDFRVCQMEMGGTACKLQIWDTPGTERYTSVTASFFRGAKGVIFAWVPDCSSRRENV
jgi:small GTP-binding protein